MSMTFYNAGSNINGTFSLTGLNDWDVSKVTDFSGMFNNCGSKASEWSIGDIIKWDLRSAENLNNMFFLAGNKAKDWHIGNLSEWNVSNVKNFQSTFNQAGEYSESFSLGNLYKWNISKAENISKMFYYAGYEAAQWYIGDISNWDVSNVNDFSDMFYYAANKCQNVSIGQLIWNIESATTATSMFENFATGTIGLNLGEIYIKSDCNMDSIMKNCSNVKVTFRFAQKCSSYDNCFLNAASGSTGDIQLIGDNNQVVQWLQSIVNLYGPSGTQSKGNVRI